MGLKNLLKPGIMMGLGVGILGLIGVGVNLGGTITTLGYGLLAVSGMIIFLGALGIKVFK